jgi:putative ABC transport system permease protein
MGSDSVAFMLNETAARAAIELAGPEWKSPLGKRVDYYISIPEGWSIGKSGPVIGVIKDFHYRSLHHEVEPMVLQINRTLQWKLLVRIQTDEMPETLVFVEQAMRELGMLSERLFQYSFLDEDFDHLYRNEQRIGQMVGGFSALAILIACLGLFGLAAFSAEQRTKEIGIRKVLGASVTGIIGLLSNEFTRLLVYANLIAWPLAYWAAHAWLQNFAYRTEVSWWMFPGVGFLALLAALLTVTYQSVRAALTNPVETLRYE